MTETFPVVLRPFYSASPLSSFRQPQGRSIRIQSPQSLQGFQVQLDPSTAQAERSDRNNLQWDLSQNARPGLEHIVAQTSALETLNGRLSMNLKSPHVTFVSQSGFLFRGKLGDYGFHQFVKVYKALRHIEERIGEARTSQTSQAPRKRSRAESTMVEEHPIIATVVDDFDEELDQDDQQTRMTLEYSLRQPESSMRPPVEEEEDQYTRMTLDYELRNR